MMHWTEICWASRPLYAKRAHTYTWPQVCVLVWETWRYTLNDAPFAPIACKWNNVALSSTLFALHWPKAFSVVVYRGGVMPFQPATQQRATLLPPSPARTTRPYESGWLPGSAYAHHVHAHSGSVLYIVACVLRSVCEKEAARLTAPTNTRWPMEKLCWLKREKCCSDDSRPSTVLYHFMYEKLFVILLTEP